MNIIPKIETPFSENYKNFLKELIPIVKNINAPGITGYKQIIIEQNFGINGILICKELKEMDNEIDITYAFNMRDKNRIALFSDLATLEQIGLKNIIISEGLHPQKTPFYFVKPVYDIDTVALSSIIKSKIYNVGNDFKLEGVNFSRFNLGVIVGASTPTDLIKIKKLVSIGVDSFIINSFSDNIGAIKYIKNENKKVYIQLMESEISLIEDSIDKAARLGADALIIKIMNGKTNIFKRS
jgi:hypothetical protein